MREIREINGDHYIKSPLTEDFTAMLDYDDAHGENALCVESGYTWSESYDIDKMPEPVVAQSVTDEYGKIWFPVTVRTIDWIIFKDGSEWCFADIIPSESDIPGHSHQIDMANRKTFDDFKTVSEYANSLAAE